MIKFSSGQQFGDERAASMLSRPKMASKLALKELNVT